MASRIVSKFCRGIFPVLRQGGVMAPPRPAPNFCLPRAVPAVSQRYRLASSNAAASELSLAEFLDKEIRDEMQIAVHKNDADRSRSLPPNGYKVEAKDAVVSLRKSYQNEQISIEFNVNNSMVFSDDASRFEGKSNIDESLDEVESSSAVVIRPEFKVQVAKGAQKLVFLCKFTEEEAADAGEIVDEQGLIAERPFDLEVVWIETEGEGDDDRRFEIDVNLMLSEKFTDQLFAYLEQRGIDAAFVQQLQAFATHYENAQYISLLQNIREFLRR